MEENEINKDTAENKNGHVVLNRIISIILAAVVLVGVFFVGYFTCKLTQPQELSSLEWVLKTVQNNYYGDYDQSQFQGASLHGITSLLDPYSEYYTEEEYRKLIDENSGSRSGVGISYSFVEGEGAHLVSVSYGSPAYSGGLRAGDVLTGGEADGEVTEFADGNAFAQFIDARSVEEKFTLLTKSGKRADVSKENYTASYVRMLTNNTEWGFDYSVSPEPYFKISSEMNYLPSGAAYIGLTQFYGNAVTEFYKIVEKFNSEGCTSLILDLRNNGGGYVEVMNGIAGSFTSSKFSESKISMTAEYKNGKTEKYWCAQTDNNANLVPTVPVNTKIYALANSGTASASEALLGVLISYGILEEKNVFISDYSEEYLAWMKNAGGDGKTARTYGKGIMQSTFVNRRTHEALKLTTAGIFWPNGTSIHGTGLSALGTGQNNGTNCSLVETRWITTEGDEELREVIKRIYG